LKESFPLSSICNEASSPHFRDYLPEQIFLPSSGKFMIVSLKGFIEVTRKAPASSAWGARRQGLQSTFVSKEDIDVFVRCTSVIDPTSPKAGNGAAAEIANRSQDSAQFFMCPQI
jgi:hypothetical protein